MQSLVTALALVFMTGCGYTVTETVKRNGLKPFEVTRSVGWSTAEETIERYDAEMPTCVAGIGRVEGQLLDPVVQCEEDAVKDHRRIQRQRDDAAKPRPYGYDCYHHSHGH